MAKRRCPICRQGMEWEGNRYRPFCSERCKLIDLGRWAGGDYRIPVNREEHDEEHETNRLEAS
ncbi:MAG: DNA gyrase inhibitor YacG [Candidatus Manganitrophaceae bacterium]